MGQRFGAGVWNAVDRISNRATSQIKLGSVISSRVVSEVNVASGGAVAWRPYSEVRKGMIHAVSRGICKILRSHPGVCFKYQA